MMEENSSNSRCNANNNHSCPDSSENLFTITTTEYAELIRASVENDIIRRMIAAESGHYIDTNLLRHVIGLMDKGDADE